MESSSQSSQRNFGRREAAAPSATAPAGNRKRSAFIAIGVLGAGALGLMAFSGSSNCDNSKAPQDPSKPQQKCDSRSSGHRWFGWSSGSGTPTGASSPTVERGGFGRTASSFFSRIGG